MNIRMDIRRAEGAGRRPRQDPRIAILHEVVVGILWMSLDPPPDASREEMEEFAQGLVARILAGACPASVESAIANLQSRQFCRPASPAVIADLARRVMDVTQAY